VGNDFVFEESGFQWDLDGEVGIYFILTGEDGFLFGEDINFTFFAYAFSSTGFVEDNIGFFGGFEEGSAVVYGDFFVFRYEGYSEMLHLFSKTEKIILTVRISSTLKTSGIVL